MFHWPSSLSDAMAATILEDTAFVTRHLKASRERLAENYQLATGILDDADIAYHKGRYVIFLFQTVSQVKNRGQQQCRFLPMDRPISTSTIASPNDDRSLRKRTPALKSPLRRSCISSHRRGISQRAARLVPGHLLARERKTGRGAEAVRLTLPVVWLVLLSRQS